MDLGTKFLEEMVSATTVHLGFAGANCPVAEAATGRPGPEPREERAEPGTEVLFGRTEVGPAPGRGEGPLGIAPVGGPLLGRTAPELLG